MRLKPGDTLVDETGVTTARIRAMITPSRLPLSIRRVLAPWTRFKFLPGILCCLAIGSHAVWANETGGGAQSGAFKHPTGAPPIEPISNGHTNGTHDPSHPGGTPMHKPGIDPTHPGGETTGGLHPLNPLHPEGSNTGIDENHLTPNAGKHPPHAGGLTPETGNHAPRDKQPGSIPDAHPNGQPPKQAAFIDSGSRFSASLQKANEWQQALRDASPAAASVWTSLKEIYNRVMGKPGLPAHFGDTESLPKYLQDVMQDNNGNYAKALRTDLGDLDRELLRATYDKDYYREPLMGYKSYDGFMRKYGQKANYEQMQTLAPADRLKYLTNFGRQSSSEKQAAQRLERELRNRMINDNLTAELEQARLKAWQQKQAATFIYNWRREDQAERTRELLEDADDFESDTQPSQKPDIPARPNPKNDIEPEGHASGSPIDPRTTPSSQHQGTLDAVTRQQLAWAATRKTSPELFRKLGAAYDRVTGSAVFPEGFNDVSSLPEHLQALVKANGGVSGALQTDLGDLDRELLRATFDPSYYKEPLMGYTDYAKFMATYGETASATQIQRLSPADRLQYLVNHGSQSADEKAAVQERIRAFQIAQKNNTDLRTVQSMREEIREQEAINQAIVDTMMDEKIERVRELLAEDDDF